MWLEFDFRGTLNPQTWAFYITCLSQLFFRLSCVHGQGRGDRQAGISVYQGKRPGLWLPVPLTQLVPRGRQRLRHTNRYGDEGEGHHKATEYHKITGNTREMSYRYAVWSFGYAAKLRSYWCANVGKCHVGITLAFIYMYLYVHLLYVGLSHVFCCHVSPWNLLTLSTLNATKVALASQVRHCCSRLFSFLVPLVFVRMRLYYDIRNLSGVYFKQ